jgi:hypothetical protein
MRLFVPVAVICVCAGCSNNPVPTSQNSVVPRSATRVSEAIVLKALHPDWTHRGIGFNIQPNGNAAIAVECENATNDAVIVFDGKPLPTVFGNRTLLSAEVPSEYYSKVGVIVVSIKSSKGSSNSLTFEVK